MVLEVGGANRPHDLPEVTAQQRLLEHAAGTGGGVDQRRQEQLASRVKVVLVLVC